MTALPPWTKPQFEQYTEIALETMAKHGVLRAGGQHAAVHSDDGSLLIEVVTDLSAVGVSGSMPITARTRPDGAVVWSLNGIPIATIPGEVTPEEAGEAIGKNQLRAAYRRWKDRGQANAIL